MLENTEGEIKNGQSRETGNIGYRYIRRIYCDKSKYVLPENCGIKIGEVVPIPKTQRYVVI
jgi:hypothetical protein